MWHFYEEQMKRLEGLSQEPVLFEDVLCQLHDMLQVRAAAARVCAHWRLRAARPRVVAAVDARQAPLVHS
jgi:hypothetical protein